MNHRRRRHRIVAPLLRPALALLAGAGLLLAPDLTAQVRLTADDLTPRVLQDIQYGWDTGPGTTVSSLDCAGRGWQTMADLLADDLWDFSCIPPGVPTASITVRITPQETCNHDQCGYDPGGAFTDIRFLGREDRNYVDPPNLSKTNSVTEREDLPGEVAIWLRAAVQREGESGALGEGESRVCYTDDDGEPRTPVALWRIPERGGEFYLQPGDSWASGPFDCEQTVFNQICGEPGFFDKIWVRACDDHAGTQSGEVLGEGTVVLPSGHRLGALLVRTVADFCVYTGDACFFKVDEVRTVVHLMAAPGIGTVVRLQSGQNSPSLDQFTELAETDFKFGLFPPLSIQVDATTDTSVDLSWDPGRVTDPISGYRVYWDTDSGSDSPYAFDSVSQAGQVAFDGTSARITGLTPDTDWHFTVTSVSTYTNPSTGEEYEFESLLFPAQIGGLVGDAYPAEVLARTLPPGCIPTEEVQDLTVERQGDQVRICWRAATDPCLEEYRLLSAASPGAEGNFGELARIPDAACWTGPTADGFFLTSILSSDGEGPWGHFGR